MTFHTREIKTFRGENFYYIENDTDSAWIILTSALEDYIGNIRWSQRDGGWVFSKSGAVILNNSELMEICDFINFLLMR